MNRKKTLLILLTTFLWLIVNSCASKYKRAPLGGEEDKTKPTILAVFPENKTTNLAKEGFQVNIEFSEFIDYKSFKKAISISPYKIKDNYEISFDENEITIDFFDLEEDLTILIVINSSLKDLRGNNLAQNHLLCYSTSDHISDGKIRGKCRYSIVNNVINKVKPNLVKFLLYDYQELKKYNFELDSLTFDYYLTLNDDYSFSLDYLERKKYYPLIFLDKNSNNRVEINSEILSYNYENIDLRKTNNPFYEFVLGSQDTIAPFLENITVIDKKLLKLEFSEKLRNYPKIVDQVENDNKKILFKTFNSPKEKELYLSLQDSLKPDTRLKIDLGASIYDFNNNKIQKEARLKSIFLGDSLPKSHPRIIQKPENFYYLNDTLKLLLNKPNLTNFKCSFLDLKNDSNEIVLKRMNKNSLSYKYLLDKNLLKEQNYLLLVKNNADTLNFSKVKIKEEIGFGTISGKINLNKSSKNLKLVVNSTNKKLKYFLDAKNNADYKIKVKPGKYLLGVYNDLNQNESFTISQNKAKFEFAKILNDTILVRKNWENEKVNINEKKDQDE